MGEFSRFIFERRHFAPNENRVKPSAFVPWTDVEASVSDIRELTEEQIWQLGDLTRANPPIARGDFDEVVVKIAGLSLKEDVPPVRHWQILGWDPGSKDAQKLTAQILAPLTTLEVR